MSERSLLDAVLEPGGLSVRFQPIFEYSRDKRSLHGVECLIRGPAGTNLESADVLFEYVRRKREESLVDRACVATSLERAAALPGEPNLALNVHASTLGRDRDFVGFLLGSAAGCAIALSRLTIEIVEHSPFWDGRSFLSALEQIRSNGIRLALDDVGLGQSNYRMILDCRPDYFKVDRYLVDGAHRDVYRLAVLESISHLAVKFGARVVAEGVEEESDFKAMRGLGIDLFQGYLFSRPLTASVLVTSGILDEVSARRKAAAAV